MSDYLDIKCMILIVAVFITAYSGIILNRVNKIGDYMITLQEQIDELKEMIAENLQVDKNSIPDETVIELLKREQIDLE